MNRDEQDQKFYWVMSAFIALALPATVGAIFPLIANFWWSIGIVASIFGGKLTPILVPLVLAISYLSVSFLILMGMMCVLKKTD